MMSFKDIAEHRDENITSNNIRPEYNALMELENRTKGSVRTALTSYKNFKRKAL